MKTIGDVILNEHVGKCRSTGEALKFLELPDDYRYNAAGNIYMSALSIIEKLQEQIKKLENKQ